MKKKYFIIFGCGLAIICVVFIFIYNYYSSPRFRLAITTDSDLPPVFIDDNNEVLKIPYPKAYLFELKRNGDLHVYYGGRRHDGDLRKKQYISERYTEYIVALNDKQIDLLIQLADKIYIKNLNLTPQKVIGVEQFVYFLYKDRITIYPYQGGDYPELEEFLDRLLRYYPYSIVE